MGFTKPDFPDVDPDDIPAEAADGADADPRADWAENGFGSPQMVHTIYIVKLVFFYALGGVVVATRDVRAARVLACLASGGISRSSIRRRSCGRCCWKRSASPDRGARWRARSSR